MERNILVKEIESLREQLNTMVTLDEIAYEEVLKVSQELDVLITQYFKTMNPL